MSFDGRAIKINGDRALLFFEVSRDGKTAGWLIDGDETVGGVKVRQKSEECDFRQEGKSIGNSVLVRFLDPSLRLEMAVERRRYRFHPRKGEVLEYEFPVGMSIAAVSDSLGKCVQNHETGEAYPGWTCMFEVPEDLDCCEWKSPMLVVRIGDGCTEYGYEPGHLVRGLTSSLRLESVRYGSELLDDDVELAALKDGLEIEGKPIGQSYTITEPSGFRWQLHLDQGATGLQLKQALSDEVLRMETSCFTLSSANGPLADWATAEEMRYSVKLDPAIDEKPYQFRVFDASKQSEETVRLDLTGIETIAQIRADIASRAGLRDVRLFYGDIRLVDRWPFCYYCIGCSAVIEVLARSQSS
jgi:hypothetical protein